MAVYFFHVLDDEVTRDHEGIDLADAEAAMARAVREARVLAAESVREGRLVGHHRIEVMDEAGGRVGVVRYDEAVRIG